MVNRGSNEFMFNKESPQAPESSRAIRRVRWQNITRTLQTSCSVAVVTESREPAEFWSGLTKPAYLQSAPPPGSSQPGLQGVLSLLLKTENRLRKREADGGVTAAARDEMKHTYRWRQRGSSEEDLSDLFWGGSSEEITWQTRIDPLSNSHWKHPSLFHKKVE